MKDLNEMVMGETVVVGVGYRPKKLRQKNKKKKKVDLKKALQKGGTYIQYGVEDLVNYLGNKVEKFVKSPSAKTSDDMYKYLLKEEDKLSKKLFKAGWGEVGELNPTNVIDYADAMFYKLKKS